MHRRQFLIQTGLSASALLLAHSGFAKLLGNTPEYKIRWFNEHSGIFFGRGGTIYFSKTKEGLIVVDSQFEDTALALLNDLDKRNLTDQGKVRLLINTHHHGDHTSGNIAFKNRALHVLAHERSKSNQQAVAISNNREDKQLYPDQTFSEVWSEKIGKERVTLIYWGAAHTNGDCTVHLQREKMVHLGDLVFNHRHPVIDKRYGANIKNWINVLDAIVAEYKNKVTYICGHAGAGYDVVITSNEIFAFKNYLKNLLDFASQQIQQGVILNEFLKTKPDSIPGSPDFKGNGLDRALKAAWEELVGKI